MLVCGNLAGNQSVTNDNLWRLCCRAFNFVNDTFVDYVNSIGFWDCSTQFHISDCELCVGLEFARAICCRVCICSRWAEIMLMGPLFEYKLTNDGCLDFGNVIWRWKNHYYIFIHLICATISK